MMVTLAVEAISRVDASAAIRVDVQNTLVTTQSPRMATTRRKRVICRAHAGHVGAMRSPSRIRLRRSGLDQSRRTARRLRFLNGRKMWITNCAEDLDLRWSLPRSTLRRTRGITAFIVERGFNGFSLWTQGRQVGIRASSTTELNPRRCEVPNDNVLVRRSWDTRSRSIR